MENGEWEAVDFTSCTLVESSRPFLLLSLVIEADEVEGEFENFLVMEVSAVNMQNAIKNFNNVK